ncbi:hypothetical protein [Vreelandella populi]|uniref:Uncharacterized protein n=1 Tax=Vreelandella populi TaxID=2498858 RepID=A0A433L899_9GAMM|nr:hypothetical protein [Halomonas populi]RUR43601.1 hypothetical protein ELY37_18115 [Halomonas populi]
MSLATCYHRLKKAEKNDLTNIDVLDAIDYHRTTQGQKPNGANSGLFHFNSAAMGWDAFFKAEVLLIQPLLVVISD